MRFERRLVDAFGKQRVWLAGDAAHLTGPVGIQSMNVGIREAKRLAGLMVGILQRGDSTESLQTYDRERMTEWRFLLGRKGGLKPRENTDKWIAQQCQRLLPCIPASDRDLANLADQLSFRVEIS